MLKWSHNENPLEHHHGGLDVQNRIQTALGLCQFEGIIVELHVMFPVVEAMVDCISPHDDIDGDSSTNICEKGFDIQRHKLLLAFYEWFC